MYDPSDPFARMTPLVSADDTEAGVITSVPVSFAGVWSPCTSRIAGDKPLSGAPVQSLSCTLTGRTWPFFSLSATGWFVIGGRNAPVPTPTVAVFVSKLPSLSVILTVPVWLQPAVVNWWVCEKLPWVGYVWFAYASGTPSHVQVPFHSVSLTPGSLNEPLKVVGPTTIVPLNELAEPERVEITGGMLATVILKVFEADPRSLSVTFTVTV